MASQSRVCVITGASKGLGAGMAAHLLAQGHRLGLCARTKPEPHGANERLLCASVDVTDFESVQSFAHNVRERFGHIDLWINNAGVLGPLDKVSNLDGEAFMANVRTNLLGTFNGCKAYLEILSQEDTDGVLINISSGAALRGYSGWSAYCASKAGIDRLSETIAAEEGNRVRVLSVAPGVIDTNMQSLIRGQDPSEYPMVEHFLRLKKEERFNTPPYIADALLKLAFGPKPQTVVLRLADENP